MRKNNIDSVFLFQFLCIPVKKCVEKKWKNERKEKTNYRKNIQFSKEKSGKKI